MTNINHNLANDPLIVFDVGANHGHFCCSVARRNPRANVYAFEPNPSLFAKLTETKVKGKLSNLMLENTALGDTVEEANFNVSEKGDQGVSSFLNFSHNIGHDDYWKTRRDFEFSESIKVKIDTAKRYVVSKDIKRIDFIKIDTQGFDLKVLMGFGETLNRVRFGCLESSACNRTKLYENEPNLLDCLQFLKDSGFEIYKIKPNDCAANEYNIFFARSLSEAEKLHERLDLSSYADISRDYWHLPSASLISHWRLLYYSVRNVLNKLTED